MCNVQEMGFWMLCCRSIVRLQIFVFCLMFGVAGSRLVSAQVPPARPAPTPEQLAIQTATEKEHQREMDLLGIKQLRPGASGNANGANPANYDESKADIYTNL